MSPVAHSSNNDILRHLRIKAVAAAKPGNRQRSVATGWGQAGAGGRRPECPREVRSLRGHWLRARALCINIKNTIERTVKGLRIICSKSFRILP
jgi:hypothetical protein